MLALVGVVTLPDDGGLVAACFEMAVETVLAGVEGAVVEPFDMDVAGKGNVADARERPHPVKALAVLGPETFHIIEGVFVFLEIGFLVHPGGLLQRFRNRVGPMFGHDVNPFLTFIPGHGKLIRQGILPDVASSGHRDKSQARLFSQSPACDKRRMFRDSSA